MLRLGILLDDLNIPIWIEELLQWIEEQEDIDLLFVVVNKSVQASGRSSFMYRLLRRLDQKLLQLPNDPSRRVKWEPKGVEVIPVEPIRKKFSDYFPEDALKSVQTHQPDLLIRFGFRILRGKILSVAPHGILSLHHGDTAAYRGGPPAFWEVVRKEPVTAVSLQVLTETLDAGVVLAKTFLRTDQTSFYRNQQKIYWAGKQLYKDQLLELSKKGLAQYFEEKKNKFTGETKGYLYRNPDNLKSFQILCSYLWRTLTRRLKAKAQHEQWQVVIQNKHQPDIYNSSNNNAKIELIPPADRIWADPCLVRKNGKHYLFIEEKLNAKKNAHLSVFRLNEDGQPEEKMPEKILEEPFHLSYPFVFEWKGSHFMVPESGDAKKVILYETTDFPYNWKPVRVLLEGAQYYDATLYHHTDGYWYLFCTQKADDRFSSDAYLHLYYSKDLLHEPFQPHPMNPLITDVRGARPAGALFIQEGKLIRPAQCCAPRYGYGIYFYKEIKIAERMPPANSSILGMHTYQHASGFEITDRQVVS